MLAREIFINPCRMGVFESLDPCGQLMSIPGATTRTPIKDR